MSSLIGIEDEAGAAAPVATGDLIMDSTSASFGADVIEASQEIPVIVDFWAPWCGPCKTLGPMLEQATMAARGKVKMVKVNVDENQELSAQLKIQSLPTVYAFYQGRPVDAFQGALPESQIKEFVAKVADMAGPSSEEEMIEGALGQAATALETGDTQTAGAIYQQILGSFPDNATALAGMVNVLIDDGQIDQAEGLLEHASDDVKATPEVKAAIATLTLVKESPDDEELAGFRQAYEANPEDFESGLELARGLAAAQKKDEAVDVLLEMFEKDREWNDQAARKLLLELFQAFGMTDPATIAGRRKLSSLLFS
jgi:putative thioredoxin